MELRKHNLDAYRSALSLLSLTGRAAVVHPAGTDRSFIGCRLCEEHPDRTVCWVSPSEAFFTAETEAWKAAGGGDLTNVRFFTYAQLAGMTAGEMKEIRPGYVVLDRYHRAGAEATGKGVQRLLSLFYEVPVLGLTDIPPEPAERRRNAADGLFFGCTVSELSPGEAVARGILPPPKYVLAAHALPQSLSGVMRSVRRDKRKTVRDACEKYLEDLRAAFCTEEDMAEILCRHLEDRAGRYLVFCSGYEHMRQMQGKVREWVRGIDPNPHVYSVYSDAPDTDGAVRSFRADTGDGLKLLFCPDELCELVPADGVSGTILIRPTVSPAAYRAMLGRALSVGGKAAPLVLDIVQNLENLGSIDAVTEEMRSAEARYRALGCTEMIKNRDFPVIREVRDVSAALAGIRQTLGTDRELPDGAEKPRGAQIADGEVPDGPAGGHDLYERWWETGYGLAERYCAARGNLSIPRTYVTPEGFPLGTWMALQDRLTDGNAENVPDSAAEKTEKLRRLGWRQPAGRDDPWEKAFRDAKAYSEAHGNLSVPGTYRGAEGVLLSHWLSSQRRRFHAGTLREDRKQRLDAIGMEWNAEDTWLRNYRLVGEYLRESGKSTVPAGLTYGGVNLGLWYYTQVRLLEQGKLTRDHAEKMSELTGK